jgi:DNA-binding transcriptional LysR family regulator
MNLNQLEGFLETVREGSFTRAAEKLFLTQPALSLQIKALEEELGESLFERQGKQLRLTDAGRVLQQRAEQILDLVQQTRRDVSAHKELRQGRLSIGTNDTNCLYLLPSVLRSFHERFPGIELSLTDRKSSEVVKLVAEGTVDFGIATLPLLDPRIETYPLCWREDIAICSYQHPLAVRDRVSVEDLAQYTLLLLETGSSSRRVLEQMLAEQGIIPAMTMDLGSIEVIKRFAEINLGVAIVPGFAVADEVKQKRLRAFRLDWLAPRTIGIVQRRNGYLSPAAKIFLRLLKNHVPSVLLSPLS